MKKIKLLSFLLLASTYSIGQNLIPNPSFEDTISCPVGAGGYYLIPPWNSALGTPDYFNSCAPSCRQSNCNGTPMNWAGNQIPFSGNAYAGISAYGYPSFYREALIVPLIMPLEIGKVYFFSCYIVRADDLENHGACNNFGFRFSTVEFDGNNPLSIDNFSHYRDTTIISDSVNWTKVAGSFIADSSYNYLMIGNFYDNANTDTIDMMPIGHSWNDAYYYIDEVCVTPDSSNCTLFNSITQNKSELEILMSPNPFNNYINIVSPLNDVTELIIFDIIGKKIVSKFISKNESIGLENIEPGIYLYVINRKGVIIKSGKIIKE